MFGSFGPLVIAVFVLIWLSEDEIMAAVKSVKHQRKKWIDENMVAAMKAVEKKELTVAAAAIRFKVSRKTLEDRVKGRVKHGTAPGPKTVLTAAEEDALVAYLVHMAECGFHSHVR